MSAYVVDKQTIDEIVAGFRLYGLTDLLDEAGQLLTDENHRSVNDRYGIGDGLNLVSYAYKPLACSVGQLARSLSNYCYQSCESMTWVDSEARSLCLRLAFAMLEEIPGYHVAEVR